MSHHLERPATEKIASSENLLQFTITISIFFLTFIEIFFKSIDGSIAQASAAELNFSSIPLELLTIYLFFWLFKKHCANWILAILDFSCLLELFTLVISIYIPTTYGNSLQGLPVLIFKGALWSSISIPTIATVLSLVVGPLLYWKPFGK
jgi:hypothetical protein